MSELVLIVDDEPGILATLSGILSDEGYRTLSAGSGREALDLFRQEHPAVVFLDIWLADRDGLELLRALKELDPSTAVIMMSGHGTASTAAQSIKWGATDYLEKPLSYQQVVDAVAGALAERRSSDSSSPAAKDDSARWLEMGHSRDERLDRLQAPAPFSLVQETPEPQRTIARSHVIYGQGLHSGAKTGMVVQPLPPDSGIHFLTLPKGQLIPAHVSTVADTDYATTVSGGGDSIRTVEHLLSALHAYGVTNLLIKVHDEIPVMDGSSLAFCHELDQIGVVEQDKPRKEVVVDRLYSIGDATKGLTVEPFEGLSVSYELRYPRPIGEQFHEFVLDGPKSYVDEIAPARTFGFLRDLKMLAELGLGSGGRLDNFILVGEDEVINTELRFPDEFVRHKILDVIGDLFLLGYPLRGKVTARLTGHRDNITIQRTLLSENAGSD